MFFKTSHKSRWKPGKGRLLILLGLLGGMLLLAGSFWYGMERGVILTREHGLSRPASYFTEVIPHRLRMEKNALLGRLKGQKSLRLNIGHKALQQLSYQREQALQKGFLIQGTDDWVNADIMYQGKRYPAKARLKGDMLDHLRGDKWSLRVRLQGENALLGMKIFSLQHPRTRAYLGDWLFQQAARREGLIALRYHFVNLQLNGEEKGIYLLEEGFEKRLLEHNHRREGPILRFDEDAFWRERQGLQVGQQFIDRPLAGQGHYLAAPVDAFQESRLLADSLLYAQATAGAALLEAFREGEKKSSEVFEVGAMARYVALADLFGVAHALHSNQFRFYFDPLSLKLHPIPFDAGAMMPLTQPSCALDATDDSHWTGGGRVLFLQRLFADKTFFISYVQHLQRFSNPEYIDSLQAATAPQADSLLQMLAREFPVTTFSWKTLELNQRYLQKWLSPSPALRAQLISFEKGRLSLRLGNRQALPIALRGLALGDSLIAKIQDDAWLEGRRSGEALTFTAKTYDQLPELTDSLLSRLQLVYGIPGLARDFHQPLEAFSKVSLPDFRKTDFRTFPGLRTDEKTRIVSFLPGSWPVTHDLYIPHGWQIQLPPGCALDLQNQAFLWFESPVTALGQADQPIRVFSSDSSGQGLMVQTTGKSIFRYVYFASLQAPQPPGGGISGAVTIMGGEVEMMHCHFFDKRAEDALNLVDCTFDLNHCSISQARHDGLDIDFGKGEIRDCRFVNCGNDGLDISGSYVELAQLTLENAGDKGLSVGEDSRVKGENIRIAQVALGIAAKDNSELSIFRLQLAHANCGLAAYQKKPEFGPARLLIARLQEEHVQTRFLLEKGSSLILDDQLIEGKATKKELIERGFVGRD